MTKTIAASYDPPTILQLAPSKAITKVEWLQLIRNMHLLYALGSETIPLYAGDEISRSTLGTYRQPAPLDALNATWRATRLDATPNWRLSVSVYGSLFTVRATIYDSTQGTDAQVAQDTVTLGSTAEWGTIDFALTEGDVLDGVEPIPLGIALEVSTPSTTPGKLDQAHAHATVLTTAQLP